MTALPEHAADLAEDLDELAEILNRAYGNVDGIDLRAWAKAIRRSDGWGVDRFLDARDGLGRLDYPGLGGGRFAELLLRSTEIARDIAGR